jgi:hypothetical protein
MNQQGGAGQRPAGESSAAGRARIDRGTANRPFPAESRNVLSLFGVAVLFTGVAVFVLTARDKALAGIAANGRTATGVVTNAVELTRSGARSYQLEYQFKVAGVTYTGVKPVEREEAMGARRGQPVAVTYDAAEPKHNIAVPLAEARQNTKAAGVAASVLAAVLWAGAFWKFSSSRKGS